MIALGFDTSNYTTSAAWCSGEQGKNAGRLLEVKPGALGLRQSEALFQHVQRLPEITEKMLESCDPAKISAIGASTRPRAVEGSYMPCFLAGSSQGRTLAQVLGVPFYAFSHQQGHLAAILWSSGRMEFLHREFLAWHLSGGTTELLRVTPGLITEKLGGTEDISGMQNKTQQLHDSGASDQEVAAFALGTCAEAVKRATLEAKKRYGDLPVVFTGGVSSNRLLRMVMEPLGGLFGPAEYSTDNAMGIAVLTYLTEKEHG
jgi:N6-L-threonylcarbamoyladenine synthase